MRVENSITLEQIPPCRKRKKAAVDHIKKSLVPEGYRLFYE